MGWVNGGRLQLFGLDAGKPDGLLRFVGKVSTSAASGLHDPEVDGSNKDKTAEKGRDDRGERRGAEFLEVVKKIHSFLL